VELLADLDIEVRIPMEMANDSNDDPPAEMKGKVMPVTGAMPIFIPMLTNIWKNNMLTNPRA
jgi:hypothetical protein